MPLLSLEPIPSVEAEKADAYANNSQVKTRSSIQFSTLAILAGGDIFKVDHLKVSFVCISETRKN